MGRPPLTLPPASSVGNQKPTRELPSQGPWCAAVKCRPLPGLLSPGHPRSEARFSVLGSPVRPIRNNEDLLAQVQRTASPVPFRRGGLVPGITSRSAPATRCTSLQCLSTTARECRCCIRNKLTSLKGSPVSNAFRQRQGNAEWICNAFCLSAARGEFVGSDAAKEDRADRRVFLVAWIGAQSSDDQAIPPAVGSLLLFACSETRRRESRNGRCAARGRAFGLAVRRGEQCPRFHSGQADRVRNEVRGRKACRTRSHTRFRPRHDSARDRGERRRCIPWLRAISAPLVAWRWSGERNPRGDGFTTARESGCGVE